MKLSNAEIGKSYQITKILGQGALKKRILDMGLTKGCTFKVVKVAPLGDPIQIHVRNYELTIRKHDAELLEIEQI